MSLIVFGFEVSDDRAGGIGLHAKVVRGGHVLHVTFDDDGVTGFGDAFLMGTARLGVASEAVAGVVTG